MMELKQEILVVDDEPCIRKFSKTLLEVDGFAVDASSSSERTGDIVQAGGSSPPLSNAVRAASHLEM
jgi:CheY-like chemotaxis protein